MNEPFKYLQYFHFLVPLLQSISFHSLKMSGLPGKPLTQTLKYRYICETGVHKEFLDPCTF